MYKNDHNLNFKTMKNVPFAFALLFAFIGSSFTTLHIQPSAKPDYKIALASDYLLEIDGIKGETKDKAHKETIEISSFSWGVSNKSINIEREVSPASNTIKRLAAQGTHIKKAILHVRKSGGDYMHYELENVLITSYQTSGSSSQPMESFSINYTKIEYKNIP